MRVTETVTMVTDTVLPALWSHLVKKKAYYKAKVIRLHHTETPHVIVSTKLVTWSLQTGREVLVFWFKGDPYTGPDKPRPPHVSVSRTFIR